MSADVSAFIYAEAALLDARQLEQWFALFAPDGVLWVPSRPTDDPSRHVSIIYDHLPQLRARVTRLLSGKESAQDPPSSTLRAVTNIVVGPGRADGVVEVDTVQVIYETREVERPLLVLPCRALYQLRPTEDSDGQPFEIVSKRIDLLEAHRHFENLAFLL